MSNDMRILKFETLINDVNEEINKRASSIGGVGSSAVFAAINAMNNRFNSYVTGNKSLNTSLALIYDYNQLNDYGKVIMDQSSLYITDWYTRYGDINSLKDTKNKIEAAKELVRYCRMDVNRKDAYNFIFWSMMALTVDKTDKEEHLSLICDFARMLKITDDEMVDILQVIKVLYHEEESGFEFKSDTVPSYFSRVLSLYA
jgi:hypothetical protein